MGSDIGLGQVTETARDVAGTVGNHYLLGVEGQAEETVPSEHMPVGVVGLG